MQLSLKDDLPFVSITLVHNDRDVIIDDVLVDTGSSSTILAAHAVVAVGIEPDLNDVLSVIRGVGGVETVYSRRIQAIEVGERMLKNVEIEIGAMDYGFPINGILGMDLLTRTGAVIDLNRLAIEFARLS